MIKKISQILFAFLVVLIFSTDLYALKNHNGAHDPSSIVKDGDTYWIFTTGNGIYAMYSKDLIYWTAGTTPFSPGYFPSWITSYVPDFDGIFWAPECRYMNGQYYLYYSCSTWGSKNSAIGVMVNKTLNPSSPDYKWTDRGPVVYSNNSSEANCIDPSLFKDDDGKLWMTYGSYFGGIRVLEIDSVTGKSKSSTEYAVASGDCEASYVIFHDNYYYLFINRGSCCSGLSSTYHIQVGRSETPTGPFLDKDGVDLNSGGGTTIFEKVDKFYGPGCLGYHIEDGTGYATYHYYDEDNNGTPTLGIGTIKWDNEDWPEITNNWIEDSTYTIINQNNQQAISTELCTSLQDEYLTQAPYSHAACQKWKIENVSSGLYAIYSEQTNCLITTKDCSSEWGTDLIMYGTRILDCQKWWIERTNTGSYVLTSFLSDYVIGVSDTSYDEGVHINITSYTRNNSQRWFLADTSINIPAVIPATNFYNLKDFKIYPNPIRSNTFTIEGPDYILNEQADLEIISPDGRVVYHKSYMIGSTIEIDLTPSIYLMRVTFNNTTYSERVIITK